VAGRDTADGEGERDTGAPVVIGSRRTRAPHSEIGSSGVGQSAGAWICAREEEGTGVTKLDLRPFVPSVAGDQESGA